MLTLENEGHPTATYNPGDAFLVETGKVHRGLNTGAAPVKILAALVLENGKPGSSPAP